MAQGKGLETSYATAVNVGPMEFHFGDGIVSATREIKSPPNLSRDPVGANSVPT